MLVLVGLLLFGIFGIAALSVDFGFVKLARVQMQNAADSAAVEGLRQDRAAARDLVALTFDDDMNPANGDPRNNGAGPDVTVDGGLGGINASASLTVGDPPVYKPSLQLNAANQQNGDMVAGTYDPNQPPGEANDYTRADFAPAAGPAANAFLVRLRRTRDAQGLDNVDGISSAGRPLPLLFGHASLVGGAVRTDGFTTRATAIAASQPAVRVGSAAATSFVLDRFFFETLVPGAAVAATVDAGGNIDTGAFVVGRFALPATVIGASIATILPPPGAVLTGYVPLFENFSGIDRVVGYGRASILGGPVGPVSIVRLENQIAPANASAQPVDLPVLPPGELAQVLAANRSIAGGLQVPVLVR